MKILVIKKNIFYIPIVLIIITILLLSFINIAHDTKETSTLPIKNKVIVIDAGHGGPDPGAVGRLEKKEDTLNLEITLRLRRLLEQSGAIVILTREDEKGLHTEKSSTLREKKNEDLRNRRILINGSNADVLLSIHMNKFTQSKYYGAHAFYKYKCENSKTLALLIQEELRNVLDKDNKRVPQPRRNIYLIRRSEPPAVLVEAGFMSNINEEKLLNDPTYQEKIAWALYIGLIKYFYQLDKEV